MLSLFFVVSQYLPKTGVAVIELRLVYCRRTINSYFHKMYFDSCRVLNIRSRYIRFLSNDIILALYKIEFYIHFIG